MRKVFFDSQVYCCLSLYVYINSSVGISTGYRLDGGVRFRTETRDFSLLHSVQTGSTQLPIQRLLSAVSPRIYRSG
jgi:hypothetical protein